MRDPQVSVEVAGVKFGRFGVSGWYRWNGRSWAPIPEPLWTEPMLDQIANLQALIDAVAEAVRTGTVEQWDDAYEALLAAAHMKQAES